MHRLYAYRDDPSGELDLSGVHAEPELFDALRALPELHRLETLFLDEAHLGDAGLVALVDALAEAASLRHLSLRFNAIGHEGMRALLAAPWIATLQELDLTGNRIDNTELELLAEAPPLALSRLHLSANLFCPHGVQMLVDAELPLEVLSLYRCTVNNDGVRALAACESLRGLQTLILAHTAIDDVGARAIAESPILGQVEVLDLAQNDIGEAGIVALSKAKMPQLSELDLSGNTVTSAALQAVAASEWGALRVLELGGSYLMGGGSGSAEAFAALSEAPALRNLERLGLAGHLCGDEAVSALARGSWPHLSQLDLRMNELGDAAAGALAGTQGMESLTFLDLRANRIGDVGAVALSGADLERLELLLLDDNRVGDTGAAVLSKRPLRGLGLSSNALSEEVAIRLRGLPHVHL